MGKALRLSLGGGGGGITHCTTCNVQLERASLRDTESTSPPRGWQGNGEVADRETVDHAEDEEGEEEGVPGILARLDAAAASSDDSDAASDASD